MAAEAIAHDKFEAVARLTCMQEIRNELQQIRHLMTKMVTSATLRNISPEVQALKDDIPSTPMEAVFMRGYSICGLWNRIIQTIASRQSQDNDDLDESFALL